MDIIKKKKGKPILKFNGGLGAILCNKCSVIIKDMLNSEEWKGHTDLLFCDKCLAENPDLKNEFIK